MRPPQQPTTQGYLISIGTGTKFDRCRLFTDRAPGSAVEMCEHLSVYLAENTLANQSSSTFVYYNFTDPLESLASKF